MVMLLVGLLIGGIIGWVAYATLMFREAEKDLIHLEVTFKQMQEEINHIRAGRYVR